MFPAGVVISWISPNSPAIVSHVRAWRGGGEGGSGEEGVVERRDDGGEGGREGRRERERE